MTGGPDRALLRAILRQDFSSFVRFAFGIVDPGKAFVAEWYLDAIAYELELVRLGRSRRLIINLPPRSLKSIIASVAFPAFVLGHDPGKRIVCVSYAADLARYLSVSFRAVIANPRYAELFPGTVIGPKDTEAEINFTQRGYRYSASFGGALTGRGGDIVIIDDPLKAGDALSETKRTAVNEAFKNTVLSRLDDKRAGAIVIVMQRVHEEDLTGFVLENSTDWRVLSLPAIASEDTLIPLTRSRSYHRRAGETLSAREPAEILAEIQRQLGSQLFSAQYLQSPIPDDGNMVKRPWIGRYKLPPTEGIIKQSWDTAAKGAPENDWSVCTTWLEDIHSNKMYLLDVWRDRVDYPTLKAKVIALANRWEATRVIVEEAGTAIGLLDELRHHVVGLVAVKPTKDKQTRMSIASSRIEAGDIFLPENAPWLPALERELFSFPSSRHDDQVDSVSQAINDHNPLAVWARLSS